MDLDKLVLLSELVHSMLGDNEPSDEELDYDEDAIALYDDLHNLKYSLERLGF